MCDPVPIDTPAQGFVNISIEIHDYKGVRTNIIRESMPVSDFLDKAHSDLYPTMQRMINATVKEILSPSTKTEML